MFGLEKTDRSPVLTREAHRLITHQQLDRLDDLASQVYQSKISVVIVFEGWDAAGKGSNIRKLTARLDPRGFKVLSTQAPRSHERLKPWLWRFWMQIPRRGQMAIFDRSWYGRVLVERVEGLTPIPDWIRAYEEINEFERTLANDRTVFIKFWLHISRKEQLRRFVALTQDKAEAWQISAEDWDHHRKYDEYLAAVNDMLENTNTEVAPWEVVPATDQYYTTFNILGTSINRLEQALGQDVTVWPEVAAIEAAVSDKSQGEKEPGANGAKARRKKGKSSPKAKQQLVAERDPAQAAPKSDNDQVASKTPVASGRKTRRK